MINSNIIGDMQTKSKEGILAKESKVSLQAETITEIEISKHFELSSTDISLHSQPHIPLIIPQ